MNSFAIFKEFNLNKIMIEIPAAVRINQTRIHVSHLFSNDLYQKWCDINMSTNTQIASTLERSAKTINKKIEKIFADLSAMD